MRRQQQQQAGLAPLSEEGRRQTLQHLQAQRPMLLPLLSGQLGERLGQAAWCLFDLPAAQMGWALPGCILAQWALYHAKY